MLNKAIGLNPEDSKIRTEIASRRSKYENKLSVYDLYQQGRNYQIRKEYKKAMDVYERALMIEPNNPEIKKRFGEVKARAFAKIETMTGQVKAEFVKSIRLVNQGKYQEALEILETLEKIQPY